ncbi:MAG: NAD(P)/FAD-dependent oxidoreductase [Dechloromonas sp.]|jgi:L-2-hydroxyglutarate oxidase LhgO|nr:NAD(P)/FAD-dependent oxidoreductase [Dechloromonas sp.]
METVEAVVIGAGVVGLACARALAGPLAGDVLVLERHGSFGMETSSRNSEVIHAGLYYPGDSLKARLCVEGSRRLRQYCADRGVAHRLCGKLIVATAIEQEEGLESLLRRGRANGVAGLVLLSGREAQALEPALACTAALLSPHTGIVDSHALMGAFLADAQAAGASFVPGCPVLGGAVEAEGIVLEVGGAEPVRVRARRVVNAAGLAAPDLAALLRGFPAERIPVARYAKGNYFACRGRVPFSRLIYPVPEPGGLGVHLTLDLSGQGRFGPDVEWVEKPDSTVDPHRSAAFYGAVRRYWPGLPDHALAPAFCGVRPKIVGPGEPAADFQVQGPREHGIAGLVNLFGIESPGLTASLALAEHAVGLLGQASRGG